MKTTIRMDIKTPNRKAEELFESLKKMLAENGVEVTYIGGSILPEPIKTPVALPEI